jgi:hypothetical protein
MRRTDNPAQFFSIPQAGFTYSTVAGSNAKNGVPKTEFYLDVTGKNGDVIRFFCLAFGQNADDAAQIPVGAYAVLTGHLEVKFASDKKTHDGIMILCHAIEQMTT